MELSQQPIPVQGDKLIDELDAIIRLVVRLDLPELSDDDRESLIGHLTGAIFVTLPRDLWQ